MPVYVVDSNFFIQAHRSTYPLDIATSYWNKVRELAQAGTIVSIDKVKEELYDKNDELEDWCKNNLPDDFFKSSQDSLNEYGQVTTWAMTKSDHYLPNALNEFLDAAEADAFIVAYALADFNNRIVVTQEVSQPERKNRIKISEPAKALGVSYMNVIGMFRELGETF